MSTSPILIEARDRAHGNRVYLRRNRSGVWSCQNPSGTMLAWSSAGIDDQVRCRHMLEQANPSSPVSAIRIIENHARRYKGGAYDGETVYIYEVVG